jgi:hypothetical protein
MPLHAALMAAVAQENAQGAAMQLARLWRSLPANAQAADAALVAGWALRDASLLRNAAASFNEQVRPLFALAALAGLSAAGEQLSDKEISDVLWIDKTQRVNAMDALSPLLARDTAQKARRTTYLQALDAFYGCRGGLADSADSILVRCDDWALASACRRVAASAVFDEAGPAAKEAIRDVAATCCGGGGCGFPGEPQRRERMERSVPAKAIRQLAAFDLAAMFLALLRACDGPGRPGGGGAHVVEYVVLRSRLALAMADTQSNLRSCIGFLSLPKDGAPNETASSLDLRAELAKQAAFLSLRLVGAAAAAQPCGVDLDAVTALRATLDSESKVHTMNDATSVRLCAAMGETFSALPAAQRSCGAAAAAFWRFTGFAGGTRALSVVRTEVKKLRGCSDVAVPQLSVCGMERSAPLALLLLALEAATLQPLSAAAALLFFVDVCAPRAWAPRDGDAEWVLPLIETAAAASLCQLGSLAATVVPRAWREAWTAHSENANSFRGKQPALPPPTADEAMAPFSACLRLLAGRCASEAFRERARLLPICLLCTHATGGATASRVAAALFHQALQVLVELGGAAPPSGVSAREFVAGLLAQATGGVELLQLSPKQPPRLFDGIAPLKKKKKGDTGGVPAFTPPTLQASVLSVLMRAPDLQDLGAFQARGAKSRTDEDLQVELRSAHVAKTVLLRWRAYLRLRRRNALAASACRIFADAKPPLHVRWRRKLAHAAARRAEMELMRRREAMMRAISADRNSPRYADRLRYYLASLKELLSVESAVCPVCADLSAMSAAQALVPRASLNFNAIEFVPKLRHVLTPGHEMAERAFQAYCDSLLARGVPALESCRDAVLSINARTKKLKYAEGITDIIDARDLVQACHDNLLREAAVAEDARDWAAAQRAVQEAAESIFTTVAQAVERAEALFEADGKRRAAEEVAAAEEQAAEPEALDEEEEEEEATMLLRIAKVKQGGGGQRGSGGGGGTKKGARGGSGRRRR